MSTEGVSLFDLPNDGILLISSFLDTKSLGRLSRTCKRFNELLNDDYVWRKNSQSVIGSNMTFPTFQKKCQPHLSYKRRCQLSKEWLKGLGTRHNVLKFEKCMPWIHLDRNYLFVSEGQKIKQLARGLNGNIIHPLVSKKRYPHEQDDVAKFSLSEKEIVSGGRNGTMVRLQKGSLEVINYVKCHNSEILCIDAKNDIIVTGSKDKTAKVWKTVQSFTQCQAEFDMKNKVLSTAITPSNTSFIVGLSGIDKVHPLQLYDIEKKTLITKFGEHHREGSGILDICLDYYHTFLVAGYESIIQLWDIRKPQRCVGQWSEPFDNAIYCIRSDGIVTMVSGANRHGVIHIWDKRMHIPLKVHFLRKCNSPVYCVDFDASHIYAAVERTVIEFTYM